MRNLLNFLLKYNNLIVFIILQGVAISLLTKANNYHNSRVEKGIMGLTKSMEATLGRVRSYTNLSKLNANLAKENTTLRNRLENLSGMPEDQVFFSVYDSTYNQKYIYTGAEIIRNSVNKQRNFFTLNKGKKAGLEPDMAVVADDGVAGVVVGCSNNFSVAISLLNIDFRLSARIKPSGYFGSLSWDGKSYRHAVLSEIPQHVAVSVGDTVETTGYSAIFPEGCMIGIINDVRKGGSDFYKIEVELKTDFKKLHYVDVVGNIMKTEQKELERKFQ